MQERQPDRRSREYQLRLVKQFQENPKRFGEPVKTERNNLVWNLRKQGKTYDNIRKIISQVYPTDSISLSRVRQICNRSESMELLGLGYIPEIEPDKNQEGLQDV